MLRHMTLARWTVLALIIGAMLVNWLHPNRVTSTLTTLLMFTVLILNRRQRATGRRW